MIASHLCKATQNSHQSSNLFLIFAVTANCCCQRWPREDVDGLDNGIVRTGIQCPTLSTGPSSLLPAAAAGSPSTFFWLRTSFLPGGSSAFTQHARLWCASTSTSCSGQQSFPGRRGTCGWSADGLRWPTGRAQPQSGPAGITVAVGNINVISGTSWGKCNKTLFLHTCCVLYFCDTLQMFDSLTLRNRENIFGWLLYNWIHHLWSMCAYNWLGILHFIGRRFCRLFMFQMTGKLFGCFLILLVSTHIKPMNQCCSV